MGCVGGFFVIAIVSVMAGFGVAGLVAAREHGDSPLIPLLLLVVPLLLVGASLAMAASRLLRRRRTGAAEPLATIGLAVLMGAGLFMAVDANVDVRRPDPSLTAALAPACSHHAVPGAAAVAPSGNHLVVLSASGEEDGWTGFPPIAWRPLNLADAELVACVEPETTPVIEVCPYVNGPSITRYASTRSVTVVEAATGVTVAAFTITDEPRACQASEQKDVTELHGSVGWEAVEAHLASIVEHGVFVDPDAEVAAATEEPASTDRRQTSAPATSPKATTRPSPTPEIASMELRKAIKAGLVTARGTGDGLQRLDLELTSKSDEPLRVVVAIGTLLDPAAAATQVMVVLRATSVDLEPGSSEVLSLQVACAEMRDGQPGTDDAFRVRATQASTTVMKLLRSERFSTEPFRIQQFAIWTLIDNPTASGFAGLGSGIGISGSGPSRDELETIASLLTSAGIDTTRYRAFS